MHTPFSWGRQRHGSVSVADASVMRGAKITSPTATPAVKSNSLRIVRRSRRTPLGGRRRMAGGFMPRSFGAVRHRGILRVFIVHLHAHSGVLLRFAGCRKSTRPGIWPARDSRLDGQLPIKCTTRCSRTRTRIWVNTCKTLDAGLLQLSRGFGQRCHPP